jgi:hypothetical protein
LIEKNASVIHFGGGTEMFPALDHRREKVDLGRKTMLGDDVNLIDREGTL